MSNSFYNHTNYPAPNAPGSSAALRAELDLVTAGFDKLPTLSGNGYKVAMINAAGTALVASAALQGLTIDSTVIGATTPAAATFTNVTVTGALSGNVSGNVVGNITSAGTSTFNDVTISGTLDLNSLSAGTITGLNAPTNNSDAANKGYVDTQDALRLSRTGGTMSGVIAMGGNKITGMGDPTSAQDAATKNYIDTIFGSTTSAAASASAAATSATNAANSATSASTYASNASTSATTALSYLTSFRGVYIGAAASNPTVDGNGNALIAGDLYWNTTVGEMRVYNGTAWVAAYLPAAGYLPLSGGTMTGTITFAAGQTISGYATLASPTFTGTPAAPTAAIDTNTTQLATTAYVVGQGYLKSETASSTYQTIAGMSSYLTIASAASTYLALAGGTLTGGLAMSDQQLSTAMLKDVGHKFLDKGNSGTTAQVLDFTAGPHQKVTATGAHSYSFSNWPPSGNTGFLLFEMTNYGAFSITHPTVNWILPNGTTSTSFATYIAAVAAAGGRSALASSGIDWALFWTRDAGTTVYGKLI